MKLKEHWLIAVVMTLFFAVLLPCRTFAQDSDENAAPFLGWNSYDCYGSHINGKLVQENLDAFIAKLKPYGYTYFVIDAGWYRHYDLKPGLIWPSDGDQPHLTYDEYGRFLPSPVLFPDGLKKIIDYAHNHGVKFGVHLMRGIPREAVKRNLPIKGSEYFARDIADTTDICNWSSLNYGVDMDKPGSQEYYDSVLELVASWGVDFIKYDDIVHKPREIEAVVKAIEKCGRDIKLSISPGGDINPEFVETYKKADMVRITRDVWDLDKDIQITFERWEKMQPFAGQGFWLDMDMIPFGRIRINYPRNINYAKSTRGYDRLDYFTSAQKKTFMTQRAMAASPLFFGGSLISSPDSVLAYITNKDMLACNQNGVTGALLTRIDNYSTKVDVWKTPRRGLENEGWIGIFNRNPYVEIIELSRAQLGLEKNASYKLYEIWTKKFIKDGESIFFEIAPHGVSFLRYKLRGGMSEE